MATGGGLIPLSEAPPVVMKPGDLALVLLANAAWSLNFLAGKAGVEHFPPLLFTALRFAILLFVLLPWLRWLPGKMRQVLEISFLLGVLHFGMIFVGLKASGDIASVAIASQLYVPFSALLAVIWLGERLDHRRGAGIAAAFAGVLVIGFDPTVLAHLDALAWIASAALVMAVATILMRRLVGVSVFALQAWIGAVATPCLLILSLLLEQGQMAALHSASWLNFATPFYSAIGASLVGHGIVYHLLTRYPVSLITPLLLLAPVLAVIFGVLLWGDVLTWKLILGGVMTLVGIAVITVPPPRAVPG
ncbi:Permease of the drug/metabolite transporter (DMT) superfamily [Candidatus Contendobacter odensis Run_B_J11]|uniref:Permease of the drug/metabolite transporter (DMT) superfamily n=2 Tax=Candidatus Contendibacter odensensis TaxID=1400860 RepID=A0A7U7GDW2_9GAMM|nr:Permease of the drug/metabolite transporter (DMT) superfamily [Candidatus Contendobacter odensis Run_B_J11]